MEMKELKIQLQVLAARALVSKDNEVVAASAVLNSLLGALLAGTTIRLAMNTADFSQETIEMLKKQ